MPRAGTTRIPDLAAALSMEGLCRRARAFRLRARRHGRRRRAVWRGRGDPDRRGSSRPLPGASGGGPGGRRRAARRAAVVGAARGAARMPERRGAFGGRASDDRLVLGGRWSASPRARRCARRQGDARSRVCSSGSKGAPCPRRLCRATCCSRFDSNPPPVRWRALVRPMALTSVPVRFATVGILLAILAVARPSAAAPPPDGSPPPAPPAGGTPSRSLRRKRLRHPPRLLRPAPRPRSDLRSSSSERRQGTVARPRGT